MTGVYLSASRHAWRRLEHVSFGKSVRQRAKAHKSRPFRPIAVTLANAGQIMTQQLLILGAPSSVPLDACLVGVEPLDHLQHPAACSCYLVVDQALDRAPDRA